MTASELFSGISLPGLYRCYYCGASCDDQYRSSTYVKDTFTNRDIVKYPQSLTVCQGCVDSLGLGDDAMNMIDGSIRVRENSRGMQPRLYSWILTPRRRLAATKAHIALLRDAILEPPEPPFVIILADSGQKQLIFRAPIALDRLVFPVMLEDSVIEVIPDLLTERIAQAVPIVAALGKPALLGDLSFSSWTRVQEYFGSIDLLEKWIDMRSQPLSRLAAWLSPSKEEAQIEYPAIERREVSPRTGGACRQKPNIAGNGTDDYQGRSGQVLFDLG